MSSRSTKAQPKQSKGKQKDSDFRLTSANNDETPSDHMIEGDEARHSSSLLAAFTTPSDNTVTPASKKRKVDKAVPESPIETIGPSTGYTGDNAPWHHAESVVLGLIISGHPPTPMPRGSLQGMSSFFFCSSHFIVLYCSL